MLELGIKFTLAYGLGSVMGGLFVGYLRGGVDIRSAGSGNAGGTNALRTQGKWFALWVVLLDGGKGIAAVALIPGLVIPGIGIDTQIDRDLLFYAVAYGAILGHVFPLWFGFRGGKGGATSAGLLCYLAPYLGFPVIAMWLTVIFFTGYVGVATVAAAVTAAAYVGITALPQQHDFFIFASLVALLIGYTHRSNLQRMRAGTESRFGRFFGLK